MLETKLNSQQLYYDFIEEYPDFGPKAKMTISRIRFYKWLASYALYKTGMQPEIGKDVHGKYMVIKKRPVIQTQIEE
jgi:hypothetical protein